MTNFKMFLLPKIRHLSQATNKLREVNKGHFNVKNNRARFYTALFILHVSKLTTLALDYYEYPNKKLNVKKVNKLFTKCVNTLHDYDKAVRLKINKDNCKEYSERTVMINQICDVLSNLYERIEADYERK